MVYADRAASFRSFGAIQRDGSTLRHDYMHSLESGWEVFGDGFGGHERAFVFGGPLS